MVTMKEIANKAGVSVSTVSLVLNGRDEGRVKSKIADNVRAIATKLGYQSNPLASSLRTGRTHILGFISEEVATTPYAGGMILGAQTAASQFGYMLITVSTDGENSESEEIAALKRYGTDGFLYAKMSNRITHVPSSLAKTPLVLVDATDSLGKIPSVEPDEFQIGYDATTRLVKAGCARIAYVGCLEPLIAQDDRLEGYQAALRDAGLDYDDHLVVNVLNNGPALTAVSDLFDAEHPDGFFCFNDARAWYVRRTPRTHGRQGHLRGRRGQPSRVRRNAGTDAHHCGTAAFRDGLLGRGQAGVDYRRTLDGRRLMASDHRSPAADRRADSGEDPLHADRKGLGEVTESHTISQGLRSARRPFACRTDTTRRFTSID